MEVAERIRAAIREVPDFPKPGIAFKDITPLLSDPLLFRLVVDWFCERCRAVRADQVAGIEARGFLFAGAVADRLGLGLIPIRKRGKLPWRTYEQDYALEYGRAAIAMHQDAVEPGARVVIVDDLLATGGTAAAAAGLIVRAGGCVAELDFLVELAWLKGRAVCAGHAVASLVVY